MPYLSRFERKAIERGREEGREEGATNALLGTAQNLLSIMDNQQISMITGLPDDVIERLRERHSQMEEA